MSQKLDLIVAGIELTAEFDFEPAQRQTFDEPGYPAQVDLLEIYINEEPMMNHLTRFFQDLVAERVLELHLSALRGGED